MRLTLPFGLSLSKPLHETLRQAQGERVYFESQLRN
jgi:hypothetical protein